MPDFLIGLLSIAGVIVLIYSGLHVAVALAVSSLVGVFLIRERFDVATKLLASTANDAISEYVFGVVPLFVLMGLAVSLSGIGRDTFTAANKIFGRMRGGVGVSTVAANAIFAAITGVSIASAAVFSRVAVPQMIRYGYPRQLAVGIVAGSSILGMLIPPSLLLIVYGIIAEQSVGDLFISALLPGVLMSLAFSIGIVWMVSRDMALIEAARAVSAQDAAAVSWSQTLNCLMPIGALISIVLGGIYSGFFSPTEAGAVGALAALMFTAARGKLGLRSFWNLITESGHITANICMLIIGAAMYSRMLALSGLPGEIGAFFTGAGLSLAVALLIYLLIIILLGTILDSVSILLIIVPLVLPVFQAMDVDLIWFGIISVVAVEIGIITPPLGIGVFVVKGALDAEGVTLGEVFRGAFPFVLIMVAVLTLLVCVPAISTLHAWW